MLQDLFTSPFLMGMFAIYIVVVWTYWTKRQTLIHATICGTSLGFIGRKVLSKRDVFIGNNLKKRNFE